MVLRARHLIKQQQPEQSHKSLWHPSELQMKSPEASDFLLVPWHPVTITLGPQNSKTSEHSVHMAATSCRSGDGHVGGNHAPGVNPRENEPTLAPFHIGRCHGEGLGGKPWTWRKQLDPQRQRWTPCLFTLAYSQGLGVAGVLEGPTTPLKGILPSATSCHHTCRLIHTVKKEKETKKILTHFYLMVSSLKLMMEASGWAGASNGL